MGIFTKHMIKLAAKLEEKWLFRGEFTEQLEEYFQAIHENLVLLRREMAKGPIHAWTDLADEKRDLAPEILQIIDKVTKLLKPGRFLKFDFSITYSIIERSLGEMKFVLHRLKNARDILPDAIRRAQAIVHDLEQSYELLLNQSPEMQKHLDQLPSRMTEQVDKNVEELSEEDIDPDTKDYQYEDAEEAYDELAQEAYKKEQEQHQMLEDERKRWMKAPRPEEEE